MSVLEIIKGRIDEENESIRLREAKKKKAKNASNQEAPPESGSGQGNTIHYDSKFKRNLTRLTKNSNTADLEKIDRALVQLKDTGRVQDIGGTHAIRQPIYSEYEQKKVTGWVVVPVSKRNEYRFAYKNHGSGNVEVKFGKASDIGYKH